MSFCLLLICRPINKHRIIYFPFVNVVFTSQSWDADYYFDDTSYFVDSIDHIDEQPLQYSSFQHSPCNCIKLKECSAIAFKLLDASSKSLPFDVMKDIQKRSCGFIGNEPFICCPPNDVSTRNFREVTSEKPWIWDVISNKPTKINQPNLYSRFEPNGMNWNNFNRPHSKRVQSPSKPSKPSNNKNFFMRNIKKYYFDFEDPRHPFRNCPPSFSPDFRIPSHFQHVKPIKNFHVTSNNGLDSRNEVDNDNSIVFPGMSNTPSDVLTFPSRVAKLPLEKLALVNRENCGISINTRIIGGDNAAPGQFPW